MNFRDYVAVLRERWRVVAVGLVLGLSGGATFAFLPAPLYSASTTFFIATPGLGKDASQAYQGSLLSAQKIKSYTQLATDRRIRDQVSAVLGTDVSPDAITAFARPDTVLLTITVTDRSPSRAKEIADLVATDFTALVAEVEAPSDGRPPAVIAREVQPAELPTAPVSPVPARDLAVGAILGLLAGLALAGARHALDGSVKSAGALAASVQAPALGVTPYDRSVRSKPLIIHDDPHAPLAEAFRRLRINLRYVDLDDTQKLIVVTSALASEGKTTTTCNLAIALAQGGSRVALVEADLRRPSAGVYLGLDNAVGLTSVLTRAATLEEALQPWGGGLFDFLGSGPLPPNPGELLASRQMTEVLAELSARYDVVLFDAVPTLPVADAAVLAAQCHGVLFIGRHGKASAEQVRSAGEGLNRVGARILGTVLTMAPARRRGDAYAYDYAYGAPTSRSWLRPRRKAAVAQPQDPVSDGATAAPEEAPVHQGPLPPFPNQPKDIVVIRSGTPAAGSRD